MHVTTKLIVLRLNSTHTSQECLLDNQDFILCAVENSIDETLQNLLRSYLIIEPEWVRFSLLDAAVEESGLVLYYACLIPFIIENKLGEWKDIGVIYDGDIQKMVFKAGQRVFSRF